jgi:polar amino acid transport system substrate-binding protein
MKLGQNNLMLFFKSRFMFSFLLVSSLLTCALFMNGLFSSHPTSAQEKKPTDPPAQKERTFLRFITADDYPPFNYYDEEGNLSGFHIDLANAICREMTVRCEIQVRSWQNISQAFKGGDFDAIIAGLAINKANIKNLDFTNSYMRMPGRFAILKSRPQPAPNPDRLTGKQIGVVGKTAHEAYIKRFFKSAKIKQFRTQSQANNALQNGEVDYLFGDAIQIMFWLNGSLSKQCCKFHGDAYWDAKYFGEGLSIAINKGDMRLRIEMNDAINRIRKTGTFEELMLRYFPINIY